MGGLDPSSLPLPGVVLPGLGGLGAIPGLAGASRIVVLKNSVDIEELRDNTEYEEIVQDMQVRWCGYCFCDWPLCLCA